MNTSEREAEKLFKKILGERDAALLQVAALREELEKANGALSIANETIGQFADSLTAAEQRNSELRSAISENHEWHTLYGDDFGYKDSPLYKTNIAALVE